MRLEQGEGGVRSPGGKPPAQPRLGRHVHRRQPVDPRVARLSAQGRCDCARDADRRGGRRVERPRLRMPGAQQRDHPRPDRTHRDLRADRGGGRAGAGAEGDPAQGPQGLEARRHAQETARNHRQGPGQADLRDRRARAQHAARRGDPVAGVRRQAEGGRRAPNRRRQGACARSSSWTMPSRWSPTIGGRQRRPSRRSISSGTTVATPKSPARASRSSCAAGLRPRTRALGARRATSRPAWRRLPPASRPSMRCRSSATRRSSRRIAPPTSPATRSRSGRPRRTARRRLRPPPRRPACRRATSSCTSACSAAGLAGAARCRTSCRWRSGSPGRSSSR